LVLALVLSRIPATWLVRWSPPFYLANLILLLALPWVGVTRGGAVSWIQFGPILFQPAESMKILTILVLATVINPKREGDAAGFTTMLQALFLAALPAMVIVKQPDLGTALVFPPMVLSVLYGSRVPRRYLELLLSPLWALVTIPNHVLTWLAWMAGVALWLLMVFMRGERFTKLVVYGLVQIVFVTGVLYGVKPFWENALEPHQKARLVGFLDRGTTPTSEMKSTQYHLQQSLIAISSGGILGQGLGEGMQSKHGFIPMRRTDFIFAMLAEEMGFAGGLLLFGLIALLLLNACRAAGYAETWDQSSVVFGILGLWGGHILINLGMTMGLTPITGIPLPFVSYGGSAMLVNFSALGLILSVYRHCRFKLA
jgi:rod shape determining protein RodA